MNKQAIINHIAIRLQTLISQPGDNHLVINELAIILRDITRDDDYSFNQGTISGIGHHSNMAYTTGPSLSNSLVGEVEASNRPSSR